MCSVKQQPKQHVPGPLSIDMQGQNMYNLVTNTEKPMDDQQIFS
jgi:hypothetical protein